jgi:hypothetical protein
MNISFQHGPSNKERVTAFVDAASKYISTGPPAVCSTAEDKCETNWGGKLVQHPYSEEISQPNITTNVRNLQIEELSQERQSGSVIQGEQLSDTVSDSSVEVSHATLPQYDFRMSAEHLAAFLAIFNITKNKLMGVGFAI